MEKRIAKINISAAGGTAWKGAKTYKLTIPTAWITALGIDENDREVQLTLDGNRIVIEKPMDMQQFTYQNCVKRHVVRTYYYHNENYLCSRICADFTDHTICVENYNKDPVKTAFGKNKMPTWDDFMVFLEERCVPRDRAGIREYLEALGLNEYDPVEIVKKTQGRMAEDHQWIEVFEG